MLEMWSIHTGEQINNSKYPNGKDCVTFHRTTAYLCCHSWHAFTGSCEKFSFLRYDSWSVLPWKYKPGQNRIRTFLKTPVVFSGSCGFRGSSGCGPVVFQVSIKWEGALLVHHFVVRQRLIESAFRWLLITKYTLDPGLVNLYFFTLRGPINYIKRTSPRHPPFFLRLAASDRPNFLALSQKKGEKERKKKRQGLTFLTLINSFNWKMSIITTFPGIRGSVVYPFFYEIDHFIFCHIEFVSIW